MTGNCKLTTIFTAVASAEQSAALAAFQRYQPTLSPAINVNSVASVECPARQFSGNNAKIATNATTTAIFVTF